MAISVLTGAVVTINGVDLSDHITSATLKYNAEALETTAFGSTSKTRIAGLLDWSLEIDYNQDYASGKIDATIFPLVGAASTTVSIKATSSATSATNPLFSGSAIIDGDYQPIGGQVGELHAGSVTFVANGALTRATS